MLKQLQQLNWYFSIAFLKCLVNLVFNSNIEIKLTSYTLYPTEIDAALCSYASICHIYDKIAVCFTTMYLKDGREYQKSLVT